MGGRKGSAGMNRREFLKAGLLGTTSVLIGGNVLAGTPGRHASSGSFAFPTPVHRTLGRTGLEIAVVSFGAMLTPEPEVLEYAFDNGINYVDTARVYMGGKNEEIVGKALKGRRHKVILATKTRPSSISTTDIVNDVETSLKALGTDYIDVIQLHNLTDKERIFIPETREALVRLKKAGKVRFFGVTTHTNQAGVLNALADDRDRFFDTALVAYNFKSGREDSEAVSKAAKAGIGIVAMKTQAGGYPAEALGGVSPHQAVLKWVLLNPDIAAAIPGMKDLAQLREDVAVMGMPFTRADALFLRRYGDAVQTRYCRMCGKCEPGCPRGVGIAMVNRSLMYAEGYGEPGLALATYRDIPISAAACRGCPECVASCLHGIDIPARMEKSGKMLA
jgi:aryl-alcohol dehydrogenase-like predicted oxidoreductase